MGRSIAIAHFVQRAPAVVGGVVRPRHEPAPRVQASYPLSTAQSFRTGIDTRSSHKPDFACAPDSRHVERHISHLA